MAIAFLVAACGSSAGGSISSEAAATPTQVAPTPTVAASPVTPPAGATPLPAIGQPADDGARVVAVDASGARVRDLTIDSPAVGVQRVRLLLPDQFDALPSAQWPALFLLHGADGSFLDWTRFTDVEHLTASADIVVVMPDAGDVGFYSDWWNGGNGGRPMWETFHLAELPQLLKRNWRVSDRWVVAGLSMGGYGAMEYAARKPGMFLAAASYSGALDPIGGQLDIGTTLLWGDPVQQVDVWRAHDPVNLAEALKGIPLYVSSGNGQTGPFDNGVVPSDDLEYWIAGQNKTFVERLGQLGIPVTVDAYGPGSHSWPYWELALHRSFPMLLKALTP